MSTIVALLITPLWLGKWVFASGLKIIFLVVETWVELIVGSIYLHLNICRKTAAWIVAFITLPFRILTALQRESLLQEHLHLMQIELNNLGLDNKELEDELQAVSKERRILELMLAEVENENDRAISKIEFLESELQDLKFESLQQKESQGKGQRNVSVKDTANGQNVGDVDNYGGQSWKQGYKGNVMIYEGAQESEGSRNPEVASVFKNGSATDVTETLDQRSEAALLQTLFSALLSLLVGMIIWEAEDSCMPLVVALFIVVGMSLKSVVQLFSTIKNKPASDAVALLSFNWFIVGTLTYPTLPKVARVLAPLAFRLFNG